MRWFVVLLMGVGMSVCVMEAVSARKRVRRVAWMALAVLIGGWLVFLVASGFLVTSGLP